MAHHEMTGCLADVDPVVAVGGMAHDAFVFFVEPIHGGPGERNPCLQLARVRWQIDVSPCSSWCALLARLNGVPGCEAKIRMVARTRGALKSIWRHVGLGEIGHRIVARL